MNGVTKLCGIFHLSPRIFFLQFLNLHDNMILMLDVNLILTSEKIKVKQNKKGDKVVYAKGGTSQFSGGKGNVVKMNVYQEISQIIKEADGILIGASNGLSIAEGYNIFADDAWFQENMGDFREKYGLRCVLHGFSVPMKVEEKWAFVSRLVKAKAMQDEPSEIMKNIYALERV